MVGMRSPALDLAWKMPGFRQRMGKRVPIDEWLFPNINTGCVIKFNERGEVLESLWDLRGVNHPMITSMREHRGYLYLGGIANNRIGRYKLDGADPGLRPVRQALGEEQVIAALKAFADRLLGRGDATITVPSFDGALKPNQILEKAEIVAQFDAPEDLATDGKALYIADGARVLRLDGAATTEVRRFDRAIIGAVLPAGRRHRGRAGWARGAGVRDAGGAIARANIFRCLDERDQRAVAGSRPNAGRNRRLDRATVPAMGVRSDGTRPLRARPCPRHRQRQRPYARLGACLRVRRLRRRR